MSSTPMGYPRPTLERAEWWSLDGLWDFAIDPVGVWQTPAEVAWNAKIMVPFAPETPASGIHNTGFYNACWYRRPFDAPELKTGQRLILHLGAVDYQAVVWVNGSLAVTHEGGYTPFDVEITDLLVQGRPQEIVVWALDDPHDLTKPRGKQDWQLRPHSIWYPRTTGIWQTVWLERLPASAIGAIRWTPSVERWEIGFEMWLDGAARDDLRLRVRLRVGDMLLSEDIYQVIVGEIHRKIALSDPGIDDYRNELLWSPSLPTIIQVDLELWSEDGTLIDSAKSYTALRTIGIQGSHFVLNGRPYPLRMVLDQGYWPQSGLTPPNDEALRRDVELAKAMGFNGVRGHQKVPTPRYLYWADHLGLLVWEEMPSAYRFTQQSVKRMIREWSDVVDRDRSHPCVVAWVPINESWGVPDLPDSSAQRDYVQALYYLTKTLDPTRPVIGNDGWESVATDIVGIHDYDHELDRIAMRYGTEQALHGLFKRERPAGRLLVLSETAPLEQPIMLTEFGGIAYAPEGNGSWGYSRALSEHELADRYSKLLKVVRSLPMLAGFCYTQFTDTYQEANGLLYADRTPKFPIEQIALATRGPQAPKDRQTEIEWREHIMSRQRRRYLMRPEDRQPAPAPT